ncbi:MAG: helix-turn-helix domain-containing protein [Bacteroidetes bacterium]|nr:MAG: helix-turn-helix domain-containing protein [Bacteroidota bacterium]
MPSPKTERRLAAVMFTDIVGYTALMQADEAKAAAQRRLHRSVFEQQHTRHQGRILQYFGDGTLSVFQSGVEAVACAIAIQKKLNQPEGIPLRIGLHLGDLVFDGTDIYGDGVNVAARIESMGVAGSILLSGKLNDELFNQQAITTTALGLFQLKNISQSIAVFAVTNHGLTIPKRHELRGKRTVAQHTLAVLPFVNRSAQQALEYLSDGITEDIIHALSRVKALKVSSRTSSFFYKNKQVPLSQIGQDLQVAHILEGSVRVAGQRLRITTTLVNIAQDEPIWSQTFNRSLDDIFALQDEMSLLIAERLREHIGHFDITGQLVPRLTVSVDQYQRYLQGRFHILKMSEAEIVTGMAILREIVAQQPAFPLAYLGLHLGYTLLGVLGMMPAAEAFAAAQPLLEQAIALDDNLAEVQLNLSYQSFLQDWDLPATYRHLQRAFELRPSVEYYQSMASVLVAEGKLQAAHHYIDTALQLDPFSAINHHLKGFLFYIQEQYEHAITCYRKSMALKPDGQISFNELGQALLLLGRQQEALEFYRTLPLPDDDLLKLGGQTLVYAAQGAPTQEGIQSLEAALEGPQMERALNLLLLIYSLQGDHPKALDLLAQAIRMRLPMLVYTQLDPLLKSLRPLPRFQQLTQEIFGEYPLPELPQRRYKKSLLAEDEIASYRERLTQLMDKEQLFLNPELSLRELANALDLPPNYLSQLLNEGFHQNFAEYINTYRLTAFQARVVDPKFQHLTLLGLAFECGFNSKTTFNTFFKKTTGQTPAAYRKAMRNKNK